MTARNFIYNSLLLIVSTLISLLIAEAGYRFIYSITGRVKIYQEDNLTGWSPKPNIDYSKTLISFQGREYFGNYTTDANGIRLSSVEYLGDSSEPKKKILIIGDSFTGDFYSSNDDAWFSSLQKNLPLEVYAYGMGGAGTLQQWLSFKRLSNVVDPDILLIQFCGNDPSNDSLENSYHSIVLNQDLRRPYFVDGSSHFRDDLGAVLYTKLYNISFIFRKLDAIYQDFEYKRYDNYVRLPRDGEEDRSLKLRAIDNWSEIYNLYINDVKDSGVKDIWTVSCSSSLGLDEALDLGKEVNDEWINISKANDIIVLESLADSIFFANQQGLDVFFQDGSHLNDLGNQIAGQALVDEIIRRQLITIE